MAWVEWINDSNVNEHTIPDVANLPVSTGFVSGDLISAIQVNSVLRQSNIITVAMMKALGVSGDYKSSIGDASSGLQKSILDNLKAVKVNSAGSADTAGSATNYNTSSGTIKSKFDDIEQRLTSLGFKEGYITTAISGISIKSQSIKRQGYYAIVSLDIGTSSSSAAFIVDPNDTITGSAEATYYCFGTLISTNDFKALVNTETYCAVYYNGSWYRQRALISTTGKIYVNTTFAQRIEIDNLGYEVYHT